MKNLIIEKTRNTPKVEFLEDGHLIIEGKAFNEDPRTFFEPIIDWCRNFEATEMSFEIKLEYLNTSSTKYMLEVIKVIDANSHISSKEVRWHFEEDDEEMLELGQIIEEATLSTNFFFKEFIAA